MHSSLTLIVIVVATALLFDYTNGFHDTANAMATTIATRALKPRIAVTLAAVLNFAGAFISVSVAATIASGIVEQNLVTVPIVFAGLVGAIVWNLVTWYFSVPSSSSHALIGGVLGAMIAAVGTARGDLERHPRQGHRAGAARAGDLRRRRLSRDADLARPHEERVRASTRAAASGSGRSARARSSRSPTAPTTRRRRWASITLTLVAGGRLGGDEAIPFWVKVACAAAIGAGTFSGGWRVIRTLGTRVTDVEPAQGFSAESASVDDDPGLLLLRLLALDDAGRVGRHHGLGLGKAGGVVHWNVVRNMVAAWFLTLPAAGLMGALAHEGVQVFPNDTAGVIAVGVVALALAGGLVLLARRTEHITSHNILEPRGTRARPAMGAGA